MNKEIIEIPLQKATYEELQQVICELQVERYINKQKIDKAIEYIKAGKTFDDEEVKKVVNKIQNDLLNILQGEDK